MKRNITGIIIVAAGVLLLLSNIDAWGMRDFFDTWWPTVIFGGIALTMLVNDSRNYGWAIIAASAGLLLQLNRLDVADFDLGDFIVPAILITIGVSFLTGRSRPRKSDNKEEAVTAILGGVDQQNSSDNYQGGSATALLGGVKLDLRKAKIAKDASLDVVTFWGGIEILVPENVIVKNRATCILGGIEDKTRPVESKNAPVLYIDGTVVMAGIEIKR